MKYWLQDILGQRQVFGPRREDDGLWHYTVRTAQGTYIGGVAVSEQAA